MRIRHDGRRYRLPDFLIIGAARSGTTSLYYLLRQHRRIFLPELKEPFFFTFMGEEPGFEFPAFLHRRWTLADYAQLFESAAPEQLLGEASTSYLYFHERTIRNLKSVYGSQVESLIPFAILRNPIDRTLSNYTLLRVNGWDDLTFEQYLESKADELRRKRRWDYDWIGLGSYAPSIEAYQRCFPRLRVYLHEDLQTPHRVLADALGVLDLPDPDFIPTPIRANAGGIPRSRIALRSFNALSRLGSSLRRAVPPRLANRLVAQRERARRFLLARPAMTEQQRAYLREIFHDDVHHLERLLRRDLSAWLQ